MNGFPQGREGGSCDLCIGWSSYDLCIEWRAYSEGVSSRDLWNMDWIVRPNTSMPLVVHTSLPVEELGEEELGEQEPELRELHKMAESH